jgi:hypothetical protein
MNANDLIAPKLRVVCFDPCRLARQVKEIEQLEKAINVPTTPPALCRLVKKVTRL